MKVKEIIDELKKLSQDAITDICSIEIFRDKNCLWLVLNSKYDENSDILVIWRDDAYI